MKRVQAAKKAVPLSRGWVRAAYPGTCPACLKDYGKGQAITKVADGWGHPGRAPRRLSGAEPAFARNKARIEGGETFRGHKPSDRQLGASPSSSRPARWDRPLPWRRPRAKRGRYTNTASTDRLV